MEQINQLQVNNVMKNSINELEQLAILCHSNKEYEGAVNYYNQIISELTKKDPSQPIVDALIKNHHCLGITYRVQNQYSQSEVYYRKAIELCTSHYGENDLKTIELNNYLAGLHFIQQNFDQAERILNASLYGYKNRLGRDHQVVAITHFALAIVQRKAFDLAPKGEFDDSHFKCAQSLLKIDISALSISDTRQLLFGFIHLAMQHYKQGRYNEAEELLRQGILLELNELWPKHPLVSDGFNLLGDLFKSWGKFAQAELLYQKAFNLRKEVLGENHLQVAASAFSLASVYVDLNRYEEAEDFFLQCCKIRKNAGFPPLYAVSLKAYADLLFKLKRPQEANDFSNQAEQIMNNYGTGIAGPFS
ncbi:MAG: tetratricopeptide repeat protein [Candidatus Melainabacteria bacterium]|nr:MAG: tetratricopeptide repeat protein [Candidatus Melainabacteria bacterium]